MMALAKYEQACCDLVVDVVRDAGSASLRVTGSSMLPSIWPGDVVTVERHSSDELQPGRIILFSRNGRLTAHRIIRVSEEHVVTRGDSLPALDVPVQHTEVVGQVVGICRNGRRVDPQYTVWQRLLSLVLRNSDWCTRIFLRLTSPSRRLGVLESTLEY
jgi:signal peptidase I